MFFSFFLGLPLNCFHHQWQNQQIEAAFLIAPVHPSFLPVKELPRPVGPRVSRTIPEN